MGTGSPKHQCLTKKLRAKSNQSLASEEKHKTYRLLVLGESGVGKTSLISQLLYDQIPDDHQPTVQQMYLGKFGLCGPNISINIEDTSGAYFSEFPAMFDMSLKSADGVLLVMDASNLESFDKVREIKDEILSKKVEIPMLIAANKMDLCPGLTIDALQKSLSIDWECGFLECSAKESLNVSDVFKELLGQIKLLRGEGLLLLGSGSRHCFVRTQSSPALPAFRSVKNEEKIKPTRKQRSCITS